MSRFGSPSTARHTPVVEVIVVVVVVVVVVVGVDVVVGSVIPKNNCCWARIPAVMIVAPCFPHFFPCSSISPRHKCENTIRALHSCYPARGGTHVDLARIKTMALPPRRGATF